MDVARLKDNFALVGGHGQDVAEYFYADLFERDPQLRKLFSGSMAKQHEKLLQALAHIVAHVDDTDTLVPFLRDLGVRHNGFGVVAEYYPQVGASLIATLKYFSGSAWTPELEGDWAAAYGVVAQVMTEAAEGERANA